MFVLHSSCCRSSLLLVGCQLSSILGRFIGCRLLSVFPPVRSASELSRGSPPNSLPPRSSRLSSSTCRATHCQSAFILSASVDSSDNRLGCLTCAPFGFRLLASAHRLPFLAFEAPFSSLAFPRLLEIASIPTLHVMHFLSFPILCFSHNHTHPFITGSTPIPSLTHSITHTNSLGHITAKTERSPQTRF